MLRSLLASPEVRKLELPEGGDKVRHEEDHFPVDNDFPVCRWVRTLRSRHGEGRITMSILQ